MKHTTIKQIRSILNGTVECNCATALTRRQDDTDGSKDLDHSIGVSLGADGDVYIWQGTQRWLRFRNWFGGGGSLHTHNAIRILIEAIKMDNEENPNRQEW